MSVTTTPGCESTVVKVGQPATRKVEVFRGPSGPKGDDGVGLVQKKISILTTATGILDSQPIATVKALRWIVSIEDGAGNVTQSEVWGGHDGTTANHIRYGIFSIGTPVPHVIAVAVVGVNMELQVTNNDPGTITARAGCLPINV